MRSLQKPLTREPGSDARGQLAHAPGTAPARAGRWVVRHHHTIELQQMHAKTLSTTVERLTSVIGPRLVLDRASFHINVQPAGNKLDLQPSLSFPEREAA